MSDISKELREQFARQTDQHLAALGRYVQGFEDVCTRLRIIIVQTLGGQGLRNQNLSWTLVSHQGMTARPLLDSACAILHELYGSDTAGMKVMTQFRREFEDEIAHRNDWLHGSWYIGWGNLESGVLSGKPLAHKSKISSKKGMINKTIDTVEDLHERIGRLEEIGYGFFRLWSCFTIPADVERNFLQIGGRYVSPDLAKTRGWVAKE